MKKVILITVVIFSALFLSGCTVWNQAEFNDRNVAEFKKCQEAGMKTGTNGNGEIICTAPVEK